MPAIYTTLALSYRSWHWRLTPARLDTWDPAIGLSAMHGLNVLSLLLLAPKEVLAGWLFTALPFAVGICAFLVISRIYRAHATTPTYAKDMTAAVPGVREFPLVYAYLVCTFLLLLGCIYLAAGGAA